MLDIAFKNKTGLRPEILSAVIGSDSFFYGLFSEDYKLLESQYYAISDFNNEDIIDKVKFDIYNTDNLKLKVASTSKPYIHSREADAGKMLKYFPAFQNKDVRDDKFTDQDVVVDYGITKSQSHFLSKVLNGTSTNFHISTVLANYFYPFNDNRLIAYVEDNKLHIIYGKVTDFRFYNQFNCVHENDYLYYILLMYDELGLNKEEDQLILSGRVDVDSPIHSLLHGYIRNIDFVKSEKLDITDLRYKLKQHYYLDLYATALCGS